MTELRYRYLNPRGAIVRRPCLAVLDLYYVLHSPHRRGRRAQDVLSSFVSASTRHSMDQLVVLGLDAVVGVDSRRRLGLLGDAGTSLTAEDCARSFRGVVLGSGSSALLPFGLAIASHGTDVVFISYEPSRGSVTPEVPARVLVTVPTLAPAQAASPASATTLAPSPEPAGGSGGSRNADTDRRLARREKEVSVVLDKAIRDRRRQLLGIAEAGCTSSEHAADDEGSVWSGLLVTDLVAIAGSLECQASALLSCLPLADYMRTPPFPHYEVRRGRVPDTPPLPSDVAASACPAAIRARIGHALRTYRRAKATRPVYRLAWDAGLSATALLDVERGKRLLSVATLVHLADSYEIPVTHLLRRAGF